MLTINWKKIRETDTPKNWESAVIQSQNKQILQRILIKVKLYITYWINEDYDLIILSMV